MEHSNPLNTTTLEIEYIGLLKKQSEELDRYRTLLNYTTALRVAVCSIRDPDENKKSKASQAIIKAKALANKDPHYDDETHLNEKKRKQQQQQQQQHSSTTSISDDPPRVKRAYKKRCTATTQSPHNEQNYTKTQLSQSDNHNHNNDMSVENTNATVLSSNTTTTTQLLNTQQTHESTHEEEDDVDVYSDDTNVFTPDKRSKPVTGDVINYYKSRLTSGVGHSISPTDDKHIDINLDVNRNLKDVLLIEQEIRDKYAASCGVDRKNDSGRNGNDTEVINFFKTRLTSGTSLNDENEISTHCDTDLSEETSDAAAAANGQAVNTQTDNIFRNCVQASGSSKIFTLSNTFQ